MGMYTEKEREQVRKRNLRYMNARVKNISKAVRKVECAFVLCSQCLFLETTENKGVCNLSRLSNIISDVEDKIIEDKIRC